MINTEKESQRDRREEREWMFFFSLNQVIKNQIQERKKKKNTMAKHSDGSDLPRVATQRYDTSAIREEKNYNGLC